MAYLEIRDMAQAALPDARRIPTSLKIVGISFILEGIVAWVEAGLALMRSEIIFNPSLLFLFIGIGLLRLNERSRRWALFLLWLLFLVLVWWFIATAVKLNLAGWNDAIRVVPRAADTFGQFGTAFLYIVNLWQYWVLTRPDIRALFRV
jgi:hypothetical protein